MYSKLRQDTVPDLERTIKKAATVNNPYERVGETVIPESDPNAPTVGEHFYFDKKGMYAKEKPIEVSEDAGKFMYVDGKFVWTRDKLREFEAD